MWLYALCALGGAMLGVLATLAICAIGLSSRLDDQIEAMRKSGG